MPCCATLAPPTPTILSPAACLACRTALSTPSATNVNGDSSLTHSGGSLCVTTKTGTSNGCLPPHPPATSNMRRPETIAPVPRNMSTAASALSRESLRVIVPLGIINSVSPLKNHSKSLSPPSPKGRSGLSLGPAMNPSSDVENPAMTFPMGYPPSFAFLLYPLTPASIFFICASTSFFTSAAGRGLSGEKRTVPFDVSYDLSSSLLSSPLITPVTAQCFLSPPA